MSWQINPANGDYVMTGGAPTDSSDLIYPAYYRISIPRLKWLYAPDTKYGSDLNTLQKKAGNAALNMIQTALEPMIDDGRALAVDPEFTSPQPASRNMAGIKINITDAEGTVTTLPLPTIGN